MKSLKRKGILFSILIITLFVIQVAGCDDGGGGSSSGGSGGINNTTINNSGNNDSSSNNNNSSSNNNNSSSNNNNSSSNNDNSSNNNNNNNSISLDKPGNLVASQGDHLDKIDLSWSVVNNATSYSISRKATSASTWEEIGTSNVNSYSDSNVNPGNKYDYKVIAQKDNTKSVSSDAINGYTAMTIPVNVMASDNNITGIDIAWSETIGASSYAIYRSESVDGTYNKIGTSVVNDFSDTPFQGVQYYYKVTALSQDSVESSLSASDAGIQILAYPTNLVATMGTFFTVIKLSWSAAVNATSYEVYRDNVLIDTVTVTSYEDKESLVDGATYSYSVKARIDNGYTSEFSNSSNGSIRSSSNPISYSISWTKNRDTAVNQMNGGYILYYSKNPGFNPGDSEVTSVDVPYVSGDSAPNSSTLSLNSAGTYYLKLRAYGEVDSVIRNSELSSEINFIIE